MSIHNVLLFFVLCYSVIDARYKNMNRIRKCRQNKKLTLKQLSEELAKQDLKISADALGKYERGEREPKLETWIKLADFFDVPVSYLQGLTISPYSIAQNDSFEQFAYDYGLVADGVDFDKISQQDKGKISITITDFKLLISYLVESKIDYKSPEYKNYLDSVLDLVNYLSTVIFDDSIQNEYQRCKAMKFFNKEIDKFFKDVSKKYDKSN